MIGATIVYHHSNRYLYPGRFEGIVLDMREYNGKSAPAGTYLRVKSTAFNLPHWVHESDFVAYVRTEKAAVFTAA